MKGFLLPLQKTRKFIQKFHIFDTVVILLLLNIVSVSLIVLYVRKNNSYTLPLVDIDYLPVSSIALPNDLESINASASAYVVYDMSNRTVVAGKNHNLRFSPASTAKVLSAMLVLEHYELDDELVVPSNIYSVQGSKMHLLPNETVTVRTLLYGMMLPSGNDAAYTLAFYYPGSIEGFIRVMNLKAKELNLVNTYIVDPSGYEDENYTTAEELARIGAAAMANPVFAEIVRTRSIELSNVAGTNSYYLENLNELLQYESVIGIKTGFTYEAGGVLLTAIKKNGNIFIVCVLKSPDRFSDTRDILSFIEEKIEFALPSN